MVKEIFQSSFSYEIKGHANLFPDQLHPLCLGRQYICAAPNTTPLSQPIVCLSTFSTPLTLVPAAYDELHLRDKSLVLTLQRAVRRYGTLVEFPVSTRDRMHSTSAVPIYNASEQLILENFMTFVRKF